MSPAGCRAEALRRLAELPFLDRLELAAVSGWSRGAVYRAVSGLEQEGMAQAIPHASPLVPPTRRYCLTNGGLRLLAESEGTGLDELPAQYPVSAPWRRVLLERLDAVAVIYRVAAAVSDAAHPICFRWYRAAPPDAGIKLPGGRTLAVARMGNAADRAAFAKRLWRLSQETRPGAALLLVPDEVRLRQAARLLDSLPLPSFLALEGDAARAGAGSPVWRASSGSPTLSLREALAHVRPGGELPAGAASRPESLGADLDLEAAGDAPPGFLLPSLLKPSEKRALDLLFDWPWLAPAHLGALLGVRQARLYQVMERLIGLGLAVKPVDAKSLLALTDAGLALVARRDRSSVGKVRRRWSVSPLAPQAPPGWRNVSGSRSRQLLRNLEHTQAVHRFLAELATQAPAQGWRVAQLDPPRRSARFFRYGGRLHSVRPDAFGLLQRDGRSQPFFLEWERRAVRPSTMAARIAPYLRYFATGRPRDDHGAQPIVLVVFDDELAAAHFLRLAGTEMRRGGVTVPLWVSHRAILEQAGPLGAAWQSPDSWEPAHAFGPPAAH